MPTMHIFLCKAEPMTSFLNWLRRLYVSEINDTFLTLFTGLKIQKVRFLIIPTVRSTKFNKFKLNPEKVLYI